MWNDGTALSMSNFGTTVINFIDGSAVAYDVTDPDLEFNIEAPDKYLSEASVEVTIKDNVISSYIYEPSISVVVEEGRKQHFNYFYPSANMLIEQGNMPSGIINDCLAASAIVYKDNINYILQYLHGSWEAGTKSEVWQIPEYIKVLPGLAKSIQKAESRKWIDEYIYPISAEVFENQDRMYLYEATVIVEDWNISTKASDITIEPITAMVEDYKPPTWGQTGSGSGLKNIRFTVQKYSFAEILLNFTDCKIIDVLGLPSGLYYQKSFIKGSPTAAGAYPLQFKLDNDRVLDGFLIVPELPRQI